MVTIWPPENAWSKAAWLFIFMLLGVSEIRNLYRDRDEHDAKEKAARKEERDAFGTIANGITQTITTAQNGFKETTTHLENLATLSGENIKMVTGGDSFCYLSFLSGSRIPMIAHRGKYPLYGVEARLADLSKYVPGSPVPNPFSELILRPGDLPVGKAWVQNSISVPFSDPDKQDFNIFFGAKNGSWTEVLRLRRVSGNWESAMQVLIDRLPSNPKGKLTQTLICENVSQRFPVEDLDKSWKHIKQSCR